MSNKNYTQEQIDALIKRDQKSKAHHVKYNMKRRLLAEKAIAAGITVSDEEVEAALKNKK